MDGTRVSLRCRCGAVRGYIDDVAPRRGVRVVCYCDDCQAFARWHGMPGAMNAHGGTDIYQAPPAHVHFTEGADRIRCLRLSPRPRALYRFHAACCKAPLGNSLPRVPFVGIACVTLDIESTGRTRDELLGPAFAHIMGKFAIGEKPAHLSRTMPPGLILGAGRRYLAWWMRGLGRPSPFFDASRAMLCEQQVLTADERATLNG
ncbi:MAG TPA: DUF6151 family protein [Polyangiaceae bacterium]